MLDALNASLEALFRAEIPLGTAEVDVSFETPNGEWAARQTRPTLNLFLHEIRRSTYRASAGTTTRRYDTGYHREMVAPYVRMRYHASVWTSDVNDEHRLLGHVLGVAATIGGIPDSYLHAPLDQLGAPVELAIAPEDTRSAIEIWSGLGVPPHAAVELVVICPAAPPASRHVPEPPTTVDMGIADRDVPSRGSRVRQSVDEALPSGLRRGRAVVEEH